VIVSNRAKEACRGSATTAGCRAPCRPVRPGNWWTRLFWLGDPHLDGDRPTFDVRVPEGDLAGVDGPGIPILTDATAIRRTKGQLP